MNLRTRFIAYLAVVHLLLAAAGAALAFRNSLWLLVAEAVLVLSLVIGITLTMTMFRNLRAVHAAALLIQDREFTTRLLPVGQPELDELIAVYNRMVDNLRDERTRLQEQQHFFTDVVRASPSGIVILDFDGRIATVNPAAERLLGDESRLLGRPLTEVDAPFARELARIPAGATAVCPAGQAARVRCYHGTFIDRGFPRAFLLVDELTEELRQAERGAYEKLIRVMAHEVNNSVAASNSLLTSSLTYSRELVADSRDEFEHAIGIVIQRTEQLNRFMRSFADVFRLPPPARRPERVVDALQDTVRLLRARAEASGIQWEWDVDDPTATVDMDRTQIEQVFLNVLQNAVDATAGSGTIAIHLRSMNGGRPTLRIEDSGPGLAPEAKANLFTPFFSTKPQGQGIGLTVVQEILSAHGFAYSLETPPAGRTTFTIVF